MALELDTRQRAMLQEMGVQVWLPESGVVTLQQAHPTPAPANIPEVNGAERSVQIKAEPAQRAGGAEQGARPPPHRVPTQVAPVVPIGSTAALDWPALAVAVRTCQACGLCAARSKASFEPLVDAQPCDWMVVGDPPDDEEDHTGAPFVGQDGALLANMLRALGLQRANPVSPGAQAAPMVPAQRAYITHVLKCRAAHGAVPKPAELAQCAAYLQREIALVQPKIILAMGRFAIQVLLGEAPEQAAQPLGKQRGMVHRYQGVPVVVTYHPKALMRNGTDKAKAMAKAAAWADLCLAAETLTQPTDL